MSAKPDPQRDVADVERVSEQGERAAGDQRAQPLAPRPRDRADVMHAPQANQLSEHRDGDSGAHQERADGALRRSAASEWRGPAGSGIDVRWRNSQPPSAGCGVLGRRVGLMGHGFRPV